MESTVNPRRSGIQSVRRAAAILRALSTTRRLGVVELGHEVGLSKTTVYGIVRTLELDGLVERDPESGKYQIGASVLPMGFRYLEANALRSAALNGAGALAARSRESVRVAQLHEGQALVVHQVSRPGGNLHASDIGSLLPAHATALGKALLTQLLPSVALEPLRSFTPATVTATARLRSELTESLGRGWTSEAGELAHGVGSIASPIAATNCTGPAAIGIEGPLERLFRARAPRAELVRAVIESARAVSRELGSVPWLP
jgi:DNA-binding IclR family transcriptional regulator